MTAARLLFAGTPDFARISLQALTEAGYPPVCVLTQPDRAAGRGRRVTVSPVKQYAESQGIEVWQPLSLKSDEAREQLLGYHADLMIVAAYGLILPKQILDVPALGCVNIHASLLPRWRGAAPIQHAILSGDSETGICLMQMDPGLDTGDVLARAKTPIFAEDTASSLHDRLATLGAELLVQQLESLLKGQLQPVAQDDELATYASKIATSDARIDWQQDAWFIERQVRAYNPVPGTWFMLGKERIKCHAAEVIELTESIPAGHIVQKDKQALIIACGHNALSLLEVQRAGRGRITGAELSRQLVADLQQMS